MDKIIEARLERFRLIAKGSNPDVVKVPKECDLEVVFGSDLLNLQLKNTSKD